MVTLANVRSILSAIHHVALIYTDYDHRRAVLATCAPDGEWQLIGNRNRKNGQSANGLNQPRSRSEMPSLLPFGGQQRRQRGHVLNSERGHFPWNGGGVTS